MEIIKFNRKPFVVDGVEVTEDNLAEVAEWCGGEVRRSDKNGEKYVKVPVINPLSNRHTLAFVGDWVLRSNVPKPQGEQLSFKVYTEKSLHRNFIQWEPSQFLSSSTVYGEGGVGEIV